LNKYVIVVQDTLVTQFTFIYRVSQSTA